MSYNQSKLCMQVAAIGNFFHCFAQKEIQEKCSIDNS